MNKEVREIVAKLIEQGWRIEEGTKHGKAYPPDPSQPAVILPGTPGGGRWKQNLISQLRRSGADL
jgi:hypothetical protein